MMFLAGFVAGVAATFVLVFVAIKVWIAMGNRRKRRRVRDPDGS